MLWVNPPCLNLTESGHKFRPNLKFGTTLRDIHWSFDKFTILCMYGLKVSLKSPSVFQCSNFANFLIVHFQYIFKAA